jgi:hypothetical protein
MAAKGPPICDEWKKLDKKNRQPYAFSRTDGEPFAFAGLWDAWKGPANDESLQTFAIVGLGFDPDRFSHMVEGFYQHLSGAWRIGKPEAVFHVSMPLSGSSPKRAHKSFIQCQCQHNEERVAMS